MPETYTLSKKAKPQFLNKLAPQVFPLVASKAKARKAIADGQIKVNGQRVNYDARVFPGDVVTYEGRTSQPKGPKRKVFEQKIEVVYEDEHLAVLNKPGGMPVNGNQFKTLENALPFNLKKTKEPDALDMPRPLHRLDGPTCGLVVVAKTDRAQVAMGQQFQHKDIRKRYKAVVIGELKESKGTIDQPIDRKTSVSEFEVVQSRRSKKYGHLTLVDLYPVTGRTHQLRIHMSDMGHPIVGDKYYSKDRDVLSGKGLLLCSDKLWFEHPITKENVQVEIKIPNKFKAVMERESKRSASSTHHRKRGRY